VDRFVSKIDATDAQAAEIDAIVDDLFPDAMNLRKDGKNLRKRFRAAMKADTLDPRELENLRQEGLALADQATKRGLDSLIKLHNVLTPEQRAEIQEHMEARRSRWHR